MKSSLILLFLGFSSLSLPINAQSVEFKLRNTSPRSIALEIPGVMNPNLSPFSYSGVNLKPGQKVYFNYRGKKHLLFVVDKSYANKRLVVNKLIRQKKKELKL